MLLGFSAYVSINRIITYAYIITLIKRRKKNIHFMITYCIFHLNPHPGMLCAKIGWNWLSGSGEEIFLISLMYFRYFCNNLPLEMGWVLHLNKLESPSPKDALCQVWLKLAQWFLRRSFFISSMYFRYFVIISPC